MEQLPEEALAILRRAKAEKSGVSPPQVLGLGLLVGIMTVFLLRAGWVPLLDSANLAFHEAGHPLLRLFSERFEVYGGTLMQLAFPLVVSWHFGRQGQAAGRAVGLVWLGENLHNVARYMADARTQTLPLVGGGEHDWTEIFLRWGVLRLDTQIAGVTHLLGWLLMFGAWWWLYRRYRQGRSAAD